MSKFKNCNITTATAFSGISVLAAFFSMVYIIERYPLSFNGSFLFTMELLIFFSSAFLITGILSSRKIFITVSGILLFTKALVNAVFFLLTKIIQGLYYPLFYSELYSYGIFHFILLLAEIAIFFTFLLYTFDIVKNRNLVFALLFIAWIIDISTSGELSSTLFTLSAFLLLMKYTDITNPSSEVNMGEIFILSVVTFGIYYIIWSVAAVKKLSLLLSRKASFSEYLFFILFPPYTAYWYYTRYEELSELDIPSKNRGIICLVLSLIFLSPMALCILQRDLNMFTDYFVPEKTECPETEAAVEESEVICEECDTLSEEEYADENPAEVLPEE